MAQLDCFSYSGQYFLVSTTFWLFYAGSVFLFILPFVQAMKMRSFISKDICEDEILIELFSKSGRKVLKTCKKGVFV